MFMCKMPLAKMSDYRKISLSIKNKFKTKNVV